MVIHLPGEYGHPSFGHRSDQLDIRLFCILFINAIIEVLPPVTFSNIKNYCEISNSETEVAPSPNQKVILGGKLKCRRFFRVRTRVLICAIFYRSIEQESVTFPQGVASRLLPVEYFAISKVGRTDSRSFSARSPLRNLPTDKLPICILPVFFLFKVAEYLQVLMSFGLICSHRRIPARCRGGGGRRRLRI